MSSRLRDHRRAQLCVPWSARLRRTVVALWSAVAVLSCVWASRASSAVRYALIVGNDEGVDPNGASPERLRHAEREALALRDALVRLGGFSEERLLLVRGGGRSKILAAAATLAAQHQRDRQQWGGVSTLFAFFFTGHGVNGKLLTRDAPLTGNDLAAVFRDMGATLTFGFFDACSSGSLDLDALRSKGLAVIPGFNPLSELPHEVLNSRGTMWVVSSGPGEVSYEDDRFGGVFTHYFIQGMQDAKADDFGISLDAIWEYASRLTQRHTSQAGRPQTPQKLVRELTVTGPVYFSFPRPRSAELEFMSEVAGTFLLRYETGELTELVAKTPGSPQRLRLFPGAIWVERIGDGSRQRQRVELVAGGVVRIHAKGGWQSAFPPLGRREEPVSPKGEALSDLVVVQEAPLVTGAIAAGYRAALSPSHGTSPLHRAEASLRLDRGSGTLIAGLARGWRGERFETWGYRADRMELVVAAGPAWPTPYGCLGILAEGRVSWTSITYDDGAKSSDTGGSGGVIATALLPLWNGPWPLFFDARFGVALEPVRSAALPRADVTWSAIPIASAGIAGRAF